MPDYELDEAYDINGPEDAKKLYENWAESYDESFAEGWSYIAPREIAAIYRAEAGHEDWPLLDIGAGTGLLAAELPGRDIDAIDISPEMLARAEAKGLYRSRMVGDLTQPLTLEDGAYGGVISSGTFTHGHVGPVCLPELFRVTRPGALFVCGTIPAVYDALGFGSALAGHVAAGRITPMRFADIPIYENADHSHADDRGLVMIFRTL